MARRGSRRAFFVSALTLACLAAGTSSFVSAKTEQPPTIHPLVAFQAKEAKLFQAGYKLSVANSEFCKTKEAALGLLIHDAGAYADAARVRTVFGLSGDIGIQAIAEGSPADIAGLRQNDTLLAIAGRSVLEIAPPSSRKWERIEAMSARLKSAAAEGAVTLTWRSSDGQEHSATLTPVSACASVFELVSGSSDASADGERVLIGEDFPAFEYQEDEFAAAIAHELSHNLLEHIAYFESHRRKQSRVRRAERDADRLMPWLLSNAGLDPNAAVRFMQRWGPRHGGGILRKRSHDGWDERVEFIEAELPKISSARTIHPGGKADWSRFFNEFLRTEAATR